MSPPSSLSHRIKRGGEMGVEGGRAGRRRRRKKMRKGASCIPLSQWESETHKRTQPLQPSRLPRSPPSHSAPPRERQRCTEELSGEGGRGGSGAGARRACHRRRCCTSCRSEPAARQPSLLSFPGEQRGWGGRGSPSARRSRRRPRLRRRAPEPPSSPRALPGGTPPSPWRSPEGRHHRAPRVLPRRCPCSPIC